MSAEASRLYRLRHPERVRAKNASPKARAARARYEQTEKCKAHRAEYAKGEKTVARHRAYRATPKGKHLQRIGSRKAELKKFGIDEAHYQRMLRKQNGICAVCDGPPDGPSFCVDHCHITGEIRGLLCHSCNLGIGNLGDDPNILRRAAKYLEREDLRPTEI